MVALEASVRSIEKDGLVWGGSKLVAVGFGIKKLQINLVVEDEKVGLDDLQEELAETFDEYIQSSDVVSCTTFPAKYSVKLLTHLSGCYAEAVDCMESFRSSLFAHIQRRDDVMSHFRAGVEG